MPAYSLSAYVKLKNVEMSKATNYDVSFSLNGFCLCYLENCKMISTKQMNNGTCFISNNHNGTNEQKAWYSNGEVVKTGMGLEDTTISPGNNSCMRIMPYSNIYPFNFALINNLGIPEVICQSAGINAYVYFADLEVLYG